MMDDQGTFEIEAVLRITEYDQLREDQVPQQAKMRHVKELLSEAAQMLNKLPEHQSSRVVENCQPR